MTFDQRAEAGGVGGFRKLRHARQRRERGVPGRMIGGAGAGDLTSARVVHDRTAKQDGGVGFVDPTKHVGKVGIGDDPRRAGNRFEHGGKFGDQIEAVAARVAVGVVLDERPVGVETISAGHVRQDDGKFVAAAGETGRIFERRAETDIDPRTPDAVGARVGKGGTGRGLVEVHGGRVSGV